MSDARRPRGLDDIEASGVAWLTERELADLIREIRDLRSSTFCHCARAKGPDGEITMLCAWHNRAATRLYGRAAEELSDLRTTHNDMVEHFERAARDAGQALAAALPAKK